MNEVKAYRGVLVDHLSPSCPRLSNAKKAGANVGDQLQGKVDPYGSDICRFCLGRWEVDKIWENIE